MAARAADADDAGAAAGAAPDPARDRHAAPTGADHQVRPGREEGGARSGVEAGDTGGAEAVEERQHPRPGVPQRLRLHRSAERLGQGQDLIVVAGAGAEQRPDARRFFALRRLTSLPSYDLANLLTPPQRAFGQKTRLGCRLREGSIPRCGKASGSPRRIGVVVEVDLAPSMREGELDLGGGMRRDRPGQRCRRGLLAFGLVAFGPPP